MKTIGLIGVGYWGSNYVRVFNEMPESELKWIADLDINKLEEFKSKYPNLNSTTDYEDVLDDPEVDAVCIATPPETHFDIAKEFLKNGKDILIEKPFTLKSDHARQLKRISKENGQIIMVGHIFEYNPAVQKLQDIVSGGELGDIQYMHAERTGLGPIRSDVSALWDLAPHDVSTFSYLRDEEVMSVRCIGKSFLQDVYDSVFIFLNFDDGSSGFIHSSWLYPHKTRKTTVIGDKKMAAFNDTNPEQILQIYESNVERTEKSFELGEYHYKVREGDVVLPYVDQREPLKVQVEHFLKSIESREPPLTGPNEGIRVVEILEAAEMSLSKDGALISL